MEKQLYSVSDLIAVVNQTLEYAYSTVAVLGEVANFKINKNKYVFFDIKDETGVINCFMMIYALKIPLEDGMQIRLLAQPRLTAWGKFSLTVREVAPVGQGSIKRAFEILKDKLQAEGLFDAARKRILPALPERVALICSTESAGYADFIKIINHRWNGLEIEVANVQVQGLGASEQIIKAIDFFNQQPQLVEVLVIIRGGGSAEDLSVFNEEPLVRAISASRIPTLVGVGHETDVSLCDMTADVRAATPSNAAQILVPEHKVLLAQIKQREQQIVHHLKSLVQLKKQQIKNSISLMNDRTVQAIYNRRQKLQAMQMILNQVNPQAVLNRGYAIIKDAHSTIIKPGNNIKKGDTLIVETSLAIIKTGVENVQYKKH